MKPLYCYFCLGILISGILSACFLPEAAPIGGPAEAPAEELAPLPTSAPAIGVGIPTETAGLAIQHTLIPSGLPAERVGYVQDQDSSTTADQKRAPGGDRFTLNRFERPFNANSMDVYFPALDIQEATFYQDETWLYVVIKLKSASAQGTLPGQYALELDLDLDGGGDWFAMVSDPASTDWKVDGVQVWTDTNDDVGGTSRMKTDDLATTGNGFETLVFDQGNGDNPDSAWARIAPDDPSSVQIAFNRSLIGNDPELLAGVWTGNRDLDASQFDLSDSYTHDQAGTSLIELEYYYPIQELSELDSACRVPIGFRPAGDEPGLCPIAPVDKAACPLQQYYCVNIGNQEVCFCIEQ